MSGRFHVILVICGEDAGAALLFRLFIEPFALLNQSLNVPCR